MEKMMMSLSSPWTDSTFLTKRPVSSPPSLRDSSVSTILPNPGSREHSSSSLSDMRFIWCMLNAMTPTVSSFFLCVSTSRIRETTVSASAGLVRSTQVPFTCTTLMGGSARGSVSGEIMSFPR